MTNKRLHTNIYSGIMYLWKYKLVKTIIDGWPMKVVRC